MSESNGVGERLARLEAVVEGQADEMRAIRELMERIVRVEESSKNLPEAFARIRALETYMAILKWLTGGSAAGFVALILAVAKGWV